MANSKANTQKLVAFLYPSNQHAKKSGNIQSTIIHKANEGGKDLHKENFKTLKED